MSTKEFDARIRHKRDSQANWEKNNPVLLEDELIFVDMTAGGVRAKLGDGVNAYNALEFVDKEDAGSGSAGGSLVFGSYTGTNTAMTTTTGTGTSAVTTITGLEVFLDFRPKMVVISAGWTVADYMPHGFYVWMDGVADNDIFRVTDTGFLVGAGKGDTYTTDYVSLNAKQTHYFMAMGEPEILDEPAADFASNNWATIINACHNNTVPETWVAGNSKPIVINGTNYTIRIIGRNQDPYADGSGTAPLTFELSGIYGTSTYKITTAADNSGGWESCTMRTTTLPGILKALPLFLQNGIRAVNKESGIGGGSTSGTVTTADKLFLPSEVEVTGTAGNSVAGEGTQYEYYANGGSAVKNTANNTAQIWFTRSARKGSTDSYQTIDTNGKSSYSYVSVARYISFCFCF